MKIYLLKAAIILSVFAGSQVSYAQGVSVNTSGTAADGSAMLDVNSTTKGLLTPRMTMAQRTAISAPTTGLLVYQTDAPEGFYYKSASGWIQLSSASAAPSYADFYAMMPPNNAATIAPGSDVQFPQDGPASGGVSRLSSSAFTFSNAGVYQVMFQVSVSEAGQLQICINGVGVSNSVVGRASGTSQITGITIVTVAAGDVISVRNPSGNSTALTITPLAGGNYPVSAHLVITKLQ